MKILVIFCAIAGCASAAGAYPIPGIVTYNAAANDNLTIGFSETLETNVGTLPSGGEVNEIDVNMASIGGTYDSGTDVIPASAQITNIARTFYFPGGVCYLNSSNQDGSGSQTLESPNRG